MSTSLLYHAFGVRGYVRESTHYVEGGIVFRVRQRPDSLRCPACGSRQVIRSGTVRRRLKTLPIGARPVSVELDVQRVACRNCGVVRQVKVPFAHARRSYTKRFERYALELSKCMTIQDAARHLGVSWDLIKDIQKRHLEHNFSRPRLGALKRIAIDEICVGKGHRYLTVVLDLGSGAVVFVGQGKGCEALEPFWRRLKRSRARIEAVAIDMSPAYISAVLENLPDAAIVFDRFHLMKLFNHKLSQLRRKLYGELTDLMHKKLLKGTRWLLLKNPENLDPQRNERQRLEEALRINQPLAAAYYMKEDLRQFWEQPDKAAAQAFLDDWIARARASKIRMLMKFADTLVAHCWGLLTYYDFPISTAALEATNNKIKTMQRQAYGFRDKQFFKLKIYALHEARCKLVG